MLSRVLAWLLRTIARKQTDQPIRKILVVRVDERVGNVLLTTPLLAATERAFPEARVTCLVARSKSFVLEGEFQWMPYEKKNFFSRPIAFFRRWTLIRKARFDVAIDASHWHAFSTTSAFLTLWSGAPRRVLHDRGLARLFATDLVPKPVSIEPEVVSKLALLGPLTRAVSQDVLMKTRLGQKGSAEVSAWFNENLGPHPFVLLFPGGRKPEHRADPQLFEEAGRAALQKGHLPLVAYGPGEHSLASSVATACDGLLSPPTDLEELAFLMRHARAVVTNDTGPMHLAVALKRPTLSLFVASESGRWGHPVPFHCCLEAPDAGQVADSIASLLRSR